MSAVSSIQNTAHSLSTEHYLEDGLSDVFNLVSQSGGHIDDVLAQGFSALFPDNDNATSADERAIRAALQLCALSSQKGIPIQFRIGIAKTGNQPIAEALLLAQSNKFLSTDILVTKDVFMNVKMMFMAEEFSDIDLPNGPRYTNGVRCQGNN